MIATADAVAAALVDVADLVATTGVVDLEINPHVRDGQVLILLSVGSWGIAERADLDTVAEYIGATLTAGHSRGEFWYVHTVNQPTLRSGARVTVSTRLRGRPLDLAPLPARRQKVGA